MVQKGAKATRAALTESRPRLDAMPLDGQAAGDGAPSNVSMVASSDPPSACRSYPPSTTATIRPRQHSSATALSSLIIAANAGVVRRMPPSGSSLVGVEAGGHDHEIRLELAEHRDHHAGEHRLIVLVDGADLDRQVDREPSPRVAADLFSGAGARVIRILVHRHVEHVRIGLEDVLRAVAVVDVVVDDGDAGRAERARMRGGNRDVVEQAEAHRAVPFRVVARRPHQRHRRQMRRADHPLDGVDARARREQRDLVRFRRRVGVGIERRRAARRLRNPAQVLAVVDARQLLVASPARGATISTPRARQRPATASMTSARSGRSGWPGGVWCSAKRSE